MQRLIEQFLKLKYWDGEKERCRNGWMQEVTNFRNRIKPILKKNPSLNNYFEAEYSDIYQEAIAIMTCDFDIPQDNFVEIKEIMDKNYFG